MVSLARAGLVAVIGAIVAGRLAVVSAAVGAITVIVAAMPAAVRVIIGTVSGFAVCPTIATVTHVSHRALIIIMSGTVVIANGEVPATIEPFYRAQEIIEIGLINLLILPTIEAEFISHLVCEIKSLLACHAVRHCAKSEREAYGKNQCVKSAFHGCKF